MMGVQPPVERLDGDRNPVGAPLRTARDVMYAVYKSGFHRATLPDLVVALGIPRTCDGNWHTWSAQNGSFWRFETSHVHYARVVKQ